MSQTSVVPKYHQVYLVLHEQLRDGKFVHGLPGEKTLVQQFGVARVTVRKALERLSLEGLIAREPGRGTRALPASAAQISSDKLKSGSLPGSLNGLLENLVTMGLGTSVKVLSAEVIQAPNDVAQRLMLTDDAGLVQKAIRIRSNKQGPISLITTYVPQKIAQGFGKKELAKQPILLLIEQSGVKLGRAEQQISACLADTESARHLGVSVGAALLSVRRLVYDINEKPVQTLFGLYRPDRYSYVMQLSKVGSIDAQVWVSKNF
jgi:GntR family transcriptional regulator